MKSKTAFAAVRLMGIAVLAVLLFISFASAAPQAAPKPATAKAEQTAQPKAQAAAKPAVPDDGFRTATMLGGPRSLIGPIRDLKQLKLFMGRAAVKKNVGAVFDVAGLPALKDQAVGILAAADAAQLKDQPFEVGQTMVWMGLKNAGKPDVIRNVRWGGKKPFPAWWFDIDDGETLYHFVMPKPCGNLALASTERSPKAIAAEAARKAEQDRLAAEAARKAEQERLAAEAAKKVPPPPPPPPPASCGLTATAVKAKGGWSVSIDGGQSQSGGSPASALGIQIVGPAGTPVSMEYQGKPVTELSLSAPFQGTVLLRKAAAGTYTVKCAATAANPKAPKSNCEATFTIVQEDKFAYFVEGDFGKERRVRDVTQSSGQTVESGVCAALLGVKFGVEAKLSDTWRVAPAIGVAINFDKGSNSSGFAEVELNRWWERKGFIGTGIGVWDFTHSGMVAPTWLFQGGTRLWQGQGANRNEAFFIVSGRLFLNKMDDIANNYQFWAGVRFYFW